MQTAGTDQAIIPHVVTADDTTRWFSPDGCVTWQSEQKEVFVGGTLISRFDEHDVEVRNLTLVGLAMDRRMKKGKLAAAFGIGAEQLRRLNKQFEAHGVDGIRPSTNKGGRKSKVTPALRNRLHRLFDNGLNAHEAHLKLGDAPELSYPVVCRVRRAWFEQRQHTDEEPADRGQLALEGLGADDAELGEEAPSEGDSADEAIDGQPPRSSQSVRHLGGWLLVAMVQAYGLHAALLRYWSKDRRWGERLRVVIDAVIVALGIGQRCVEGVRRLVASSGDILLRAKRVPSESWARRVLKRYVEEIGAAYAHLAMTQNYLERAAAQSKGATVFYVDNHLRPYSGKHTIRKGWRMQDKRVVSGITDYYVHDEAGRPVYRLSAPSNDTLTAWLMPVLEVLRAALGESQRMLVAFDRAGAFPEQLAELRDEGFEFVTYERRPYQGLATSAFTEKVTVDGETYGVHESRLANLGKGRGRVRRIALLTPSGQQVNLLAVSEENKERLIEVMLGRWVQENGFKHGVERWGINQLDRHKVLPYPPDAVIPNPARRRADNALRLARHREGDARNQLARMKSGDRRRVKVQRDLQEALADQAALEAQRPYLPKHAALKDTELKDQLVYHHGDYKTLLDTIRIACANAESELAVVLAGGLRRPTETKKVLANLFAAPGQVRVNGKSITVRLEPVGNRNEKQAIEKLFQEVNRRKLTLPGDPECRPLVFRAHFS